MKRKCRQAAGAPTVFFFLRIFPLKISSLHLLLLWAGGRMRRQSGGAARKQVVSERKNGALLPGFHAMSWRSSSRRLTSRLVAAASVLLNFSDSFGIFPEGKLIDVKDLQSP